MISIRLLVYLLFAERGSELKSALIVTCGEYFKYPKIGIKLSNPPQIYTYLFIHSLINFAPLQIHLLSFQIQISFVIFHHKVTGLTFQKISYLIFLP